MKKEKLKYMGVVAVLAFFAGIYLASATTVITDIQVIIGNVSVGPDAIQVGTTTIGGESITTTDVHVSGELRVAGNATITEKQDVAGSQLIAGNLQIGIAAPMGLTVESETAMDGMLPTGTYCYRVSAFNAAGETSVSTLVCNTTLPGHNAEDITWEPVTFATGYGIFTNRTGNWLRLANVSAPATSFRDNGARTPDGAMPVGYTQGSATILGNVGIGTTSPGAKLEVNGSVRIVDGTQGANNVLTSDANGLASWQASGGIPSGVIVMWSGSVANIPDGWHLCDGTIGTPDLRDRFIVGAGGSYSVDNTGGSSTHAHGSGSYSAPDHAHTISTNIGSSVYRGKSQYLGVTRDHGDDFGNDYEKNRYGTPDNTLTTSSAGGGPLTGTSGSASSLPPYYALAYIMKL